MRLQKVLVLVAYLAEPSVDMHLLYRRMFDVTPALSVLHAMKLTLNNQPHLCAGMYVRYVYVI